MPLLPRLVSCWVFPSCSLQSRAMIQNSTSSFIKLPQKCMLTPSSSPGMELDIQLPHPHQYRRSPLPTHLCLPIPAAPGVQSHTSGPQGSQHPYQHHAWVRKLHFLLPERRRTTNSFHKKIPSPRFPELLVIGRAREVGDITEPGL